MLEPWRFELGRRRPKSRRYSSATEPSSDIGDSMGKGAELDVRSEGLVRSEHQEEMPEEDGGVEG